MRRIDAWTFIVRATLGAAPALLGCPDPEEGACCDRDCAAPTGEVATACPDDAGTSKACGGFAGLRCGDGEFCNFEASGSVCGQFDGLGVCATLPSVCTLEDRPVCGCDGDTYPNACAAHANGVSVAAPGACAAVP